MQRGQLELFVWDFEEDSVSLRHWNFKICPWVLWVSILYSPGGQSSTTWEGWVWRMSKSSEEILDPFSIPVLVFLKPGYIPVPGCVNHLCIFMINLPFFFFFFFAWASVRFSSVASNQKNLNQSTFTESVFHLALPLFQGADKDRELMGKMCKQIVHYQAGRFSFFVHSPP